MTAESARRLLHRIATPLLAAGAGGATRPGYAHPMVQRPRTPTVPYASTTADGRLHYLHGKTVVYPDGRRQPISWFARHLTASAAVGAVPTGYRVAVSPRPRRPCLRRESPPPCHSG